MSCSLILEPPAVLQTKIGDFGTGKTWMLTEAPLQKLVAQRQAPVNANGQVMSYKQTEMRSERTGLGAGLRAVGCCRWSYAFSADVGTPIVRAMHGNSGGVRGAAWLWPISGVCTTLSR